MPISNFGML